MMRLNTIRAIAHPYGNRIDLSWFNPEPENYRGLLIIRRETTYPTSPDDGFLLGEIKQESLFEIDLKFQDELNNKDLSGDLRAKFFAHYISLSSEAFIEVKVPGSRWRISDGQWRYLIVKSTLVLTVYFNGPYTIEDGFLKNTFEIERKFLNELNNKELSAGMRAEFFTHDISLSDKATIYTKVPASTWSIVDQEKRYLIVKNPAMLTVYFRGPSPYSIEDGYLKGETVYYYTLFPYASDQNEYYYDPYNRISAMASSPCNTAGRMYDLLPSIYHRYDTKEQLRHFLEIPGSVLDQMYSFASAMHDLYNLERIEGSLLPLLAEWIDWHLDRRLEIAEQRNEVRNAPYIYKAVGTIPVIEATVKRIIGWENRTKEFVHNIFLTNTPERLNIFARTRDANGEWEERGETISPIPLSLDFAYEGRPAAVYDAEGTLWLLYHTPKLRFCISEKKRRVTWDIWYKTYSKEQGWAPSQALTNTFTLDRHPTAAFHAGSLWGFWDTYDRATRTWSINYRRLTNGQWSEIEDFPILENIPDRVDVHSWTEEYRNHRSVDFTETPSDTKFRTWHIKGERRMPWAAIDSTGGMWLFWLEKIQDERKWRLKYNRHNGEKWELEPSGSFPLADGDDPRVEHDLFVLIRPVQSLYDESIYVFWARRSAFDGPREIVYRIKDNMDPRDSQWSQLYVLPKSETEQEVCEADDREPAAFMNGDEIELFWSSNQNEGWSVWHGLLAELEHNGRDEGSKVHSNPYSQRSPVPVLIDEGEQDKRTLLIYRSNESLHYTSEAYKATKIVDFRYAGCITGDNRNTTKNTRRGKLEDFQTYTYDTGREGKRTNENKYSRETVGIYLSPETEEEKKISQNQRLLEDVLKKFMLVQARAVFIIKPAVFPEFIYSYDKPEENIRDKLLRDTLSLSTTAEYIGVSDILKDVAPDWIWVRSVKFKKTEDEENKYTDHQSVDFATIPPDTTFRTWHSALEEGGE
ncbi:MAG: phage tail protein [bacterium]